MVSVFHTNRLYPLHFRLGQNVLASLFTVNINISSGIFLYRAIKINILACI